MHNLSLQAVFGNRERFNKRKNNKMFKRVSEKVAKENKYNCQFCGIDCKDNYDIVNVDGNYDNNSHSNLAIGCSLCSECLFLDGYSLNYSGDNKLIYMPEITQPELNLIVSGIINIIHNGEHKDKVLSSKTLYSSISDRSEILMNICDSDLSHPGVFMYINSSYQEELELLKGIRLLISLKDS